jgi:hypothetical protein
LLAAGGSVGLIAGESTGPDVAGLRLGVLAGGSLGLVAGGSLGLAAGASALGSSRAGRPEGGVRSGLGVVDPAGLDAALGTQQPRTSRVSRVSQVRRHCCAMAARGDAVQTITRATAAMIGRMTICICMKPSSHQRAASRAHRNP